MPELTKKEQIQLYVLRPLFMSAVAFVAIALFEVGWPNWFSFLGIATGFFIGNGLAVTFGSSPKKQSQTKSTKKQKVGKVIIYVLLVALFGVLVVRFFLLLE
ncbi:hypothetical protein [Alteribacter aurantiacus]|uniref:hypothetical protein n=1 Tax=Alteribacter aurantiacus TaxID=254410 RepID=UPI0003FEFA1A|nr:hypothetical protein [Alteribacter aurantiacus]